MKSSDLRAWQQAMGISGREAARALGGFAEDARVIESTRTHLFLATELAAKLEKMGRELKALRAAMHIDDRQGCLID